MLFVMLISCNGQEQKQENEGLNGQPEVYSEEDLKEAENLEQEAENLEQDLDAFVREM